MNARDIIVIGASAGALDALRKVISELPFDLRATVFVVRHTIASAESLLPEILERAGRLKATHPDDGERFKPGHIYCAPPDRHMLIEDGCVRLTRGPKENRFRPAVDPLFRSAALALRTRVVGVIFSGALDDGTAGLWSVKYRGGVTIVQDTHEAEFPSMPQSALNHVAIDYCLPIQEIAPTLVRLAKDPVEGNGHGVTASNLKIENRIAFGDFDALSSIERLGNLSSFTCPDCHGSMREIRQEEFIRFRCRTGHAYTATALLAEQNEMVENTLSNTMRALEENVALNDYLREHARRNGRRPGTDVFLSTAESYRARLIQRILLNHDAPFVPSVPLAINNAPLGEAEEIVETTA
ncbi:MAG TPA: chemotaxis protein CheB [Pyrinomonadaceae bacterium]|nr:chemotaxis protein CheB [Pyrinomonadaceae bacterium]